MDPYRSLKRIYVVPAFSREQQEEAVRRAGALVEKEDIRLALAPNMAGLFSREHGAPDERRAPLLQKGVQDAWRACRARGAALAATCRPRTVSGIEVPAPEGGRYLDHMAGVMVYLRRRGDRRMAELVKHPWRPPSRISLDNDEGGEGLGRITRSFRRRFEEELRELEAGYVRGLRDPGLQEAFDRLVEVWGSEQGAMSVSHVPTVLDLMQLTAILDNRKKINELILRLEEIRVLLENQDRPGLEPCG